MCIRDSADAVRRVWAALSCDGAGADAGARPRDAGGGADNEYQARGLAAEPGAAEAACMAALAHVTERTIWVDSWMGGAELLAGERGLRALRAALRAALGAGWAVAGLAVAQSAHEGVVECTGAAVGASDAAPGAVGFRATFRFDACAEPGAHGAKRAGAISMAAIAWDVHAAAAFARGGERSGPLAPRTAAV